VGTVNAVHMLRYWVFKLADRSRWYPPMLVYERWGNKVVRCDFNM